MSFDIVIAECLTCGAKRYAWCEEDAKTKLSKHICNFSQEDIDEILDKILKENE